MSRRHCSRTYYDDDRRRFKTDLGLVQFQVAQSLGDCGLFALSARHSLEKLCYL